MKRVLSISLALVLCLALAAPAFAASESVTIAGVGADAVTWPFSPEAAPFDELKMWRAAGADAILKDLVLDKTYDASGYDYLVVDMMISDASLTQFGEGMWMVLSSGDVDTKNVRTTAFGYASDAEGGPVSSHPTDGAKLYTEMKANEWVTVWFPIKDSYAWDSHPEAFDASAINMIRFQVVGLGLLVKADASVTIKNLRFSTDKEGAAANNNNNNNATTNPPPANDPKQPAPGDKETPNPKTGDNTVIFFAVGALVVAGGAFAVLRKRVKA